MNLIYLIEQSLLEKEEKRKIGKEISGEHWPSSASLKIGDKTEGECLLALYRKKTGVQETNPFSPDTLQKFAWGNLFHDWISDLLEKECLKGNIKSVEKEVNFKLKEPRLQNLISGRIDMILNGKIGLEIKSSFGRFFFFFVFQ